MIVKGMDGNIVTQGLNWSVNVYNTILPKLVKVLVEFKKPRVKIDTKKNNIGA